MDELEHWLNRYINKTVVWPDGTVVMVKELIGKAGTMKIEMYPRDHNPPHFHAFSSCGSIDAVFSLADCSLLRGMISRKDEKRVKAFFDAHKELLLHYWDEKVQAHR